MQVVCSTTSRGEICSPVSLTRTTGRRPPGRASDVGRGGNGMEWPSHDGAPVGRDRSIMEAGMFFPSFSVVLSCIFAFLCALLTLPFTGPPLSLPTGSQETWFDMFSNPNSVRYRHEHLQRRSPASPRPATEGVLPRTRALGARPHPEQHRRPLEHG